MDRVCFYRHLPLSFAAVVRRRHSPLITVVRKWYGELIMVTGIMNKCRCKVAMVLTRIRRAIRSKPVCSPRQGIIGTDDTSPRCNELQCTRSSKSNEVTIRNKDCVDHWFVLIAFVVLLFVTVLIANCS